MWAASGRHHLTVTVGEEETGAVVRSPEVSLPAGLMFQHCFRPWNTSIVLVLARGIACVL